MIQLKSFDCPLVYEFLIVPPGHNNVWKDVTRQRKLNHDRQH
jgi:hypothetical protein